VSAVALAAVCVTVFVMPQQWMVVRGILSGRIPYSYLGDIAAFGPLFRLAWYAVAAALGLCVMALVPARAMFFTRLGSNTMGVYIWHLLLLRLFGVTASVPFMAYFVASQDAAARPALSLLPVALSIAVVLVFSHKPPFGILAGGIMNAVNRRAAPRPQDI
jgi:fucose 4-O-acetylase-like acetyltransferase